MSRENYCPECGSRHYEDFVRCPTCHALIVEESPWTTRVVFTNLLAIPAAVIAFLGFEMALDYAAAAAPPELLGNLFAMLYKPLFGNLISQAIVICALYGFFVLLLRWRTIRRQIRAFEQVRRVCAKRGQRLDEEVLVTAREQLDERRLTPYNSFIAFHRLRWMVGAASAAEADRQAVLETLRQHGESDWDSLESSFAFTQYLIWLLPTAGFLGTVWGMTDALNAFSGAIGMASGQQQSLEFSSSLAATATGLGTAFHTTLVGLAAVIPLLLFATALKRHSQHLLEQMDKYFLRLAADAFFQVGSAPAPVAETLPPALAPRPEEPTAEETATARLQREAARLQARLAEVEVAERTATADPDPLLTLRPLADDAPTPTATANRPAEDQTDATERQS